MRNFLSEKVTALEPSGIRKFFDIVSEMPEAISLGVGEPDFDTPWRVREAGITSLEKGKTFYTSNAGLKELRYEISQYLERKYQLVYHPDHEILVTVGGSEGIDAAMRSILNPGDEVIVAAARCIENVFGAIGKCYRTGGDEFAVVVFDPEEDRNALSEKLDKEIRRYNRNSRYRMSISRGFSSIRDDRGKLKTTGEWKYEADTNMYQNKMKERKTHEL